MSFATLTWSAAWILLAAGAGVRLWRMTSAPEPFVQNGYRWLAVAAVGFGIGGAAQQALDGLAGGAPPLRLADLISLAALAAVVIGLVTIAVGRAGDDRGQGEPPKVLAPGRWLRRGEAGAAVWPPDTGALLDSAMFVVALFAICLITMFGPDYVASGAGPGGFALDLIRPVADLMALGLVLLVMPRGPRRIALPTLALVAVTIGDCLAVAGRASGTGPGVGSQLALALALGLLCATPAPRADPASPGDRTYAGLWLDFAWSAAVRLAGPVGAAVAAVVIAGLAVFGHPVGLRAVAVTGAIVVGLLAIRLGLFATQVVAVTASAQASDLVFRSLADSTSDTVLICHATGFVEYISPAAAEFGYDRGQLAGTQIFDIVHPDDRAAGVRAALTALRSASGTATFAGRVRAVDGSWRQVSAALSRYGQPADPARLLITCHDDSELAALRRQLTQLTFHDGLTGLPNRAYVEDRVRELSQAADPQAMAAAVLVALDSDALVPDLGGQPGESLVASQAGRRLRAAAPPGAIVARWGGEVFAVLIAGSGSGGPDVTDRAQLAELAEHLARAIAAGPFQLAAEEVAMTASLGVAASPAGQADQLLGNAHVAMVRAREAGGGRVEMFSTQMQATARRRAELTAALTEAIADHALRVTYQPVAELTTGRVTAVEAAISFTRASERFSQAELLGVAADSGLILRLNDWLLRAACEQVAAWRAAGAAVGLVVSVSPRQLTGPGFATSVLAALDAAELPPQALSLQIPEQALIDAAASSTAELAGLRGKGIRVAIADFGTGYASLGYLRRLAVDGIKIDGSFTAGLGSDPTLTLLMSAIVSLGRDLGIEMIAAGIDRPDQVELVMAMGCGLGQGGWLGGPVPPGAIDPVTAGHLASWQHAASLNTHIATDQAGDPACSPAS